MFRWIIGGIIHETNTWSPLLTTIDDFAQDDQLLFGAPALNHHAQGQNPWSAFIHAAQEAGVEVRATLTALAAPSGLIQRSDYELLKAQLLAGVRQQGPAHGVLLWLHGAMVAAGYADADGDLLAAVRKQVGDVPVIAVLDYHANLSAAMVANATALIGYDTYPHIDEYASGQEAAQLMLRVNRGEVRPVQALAKPPVLAPGVFARSGCGPMQELHRTIAQWEEEGRILNGSAFGGFPYADVYEAGLGLIVVTNSDLELAEQLVGQLQRQVWADRHAFARTLPTPEAAVKLALDSPSPPVLLADVADNPGGGATGDSVALLRALQAAGARDAVIGSICDAPAVRACLARGIGQGITLDIGGKTGQGEGWRIQGYIRLLSDGQYLGDGPMRGGEPGRMGHTAVVEVEGITVMLTERRVQAVDAQVFRSQGIEPTRRRITVVKSTVHYRAAFEPLMGHIIEVHGPGLVNPDVRAYHYRHVRRPIFPLDSL